MMTIFLGVQGAFTTLLRDRLQVLGEIMAQEGVTVFQGARYKPLPAIAQVTFADS